MPSERVIRRLEQRIEWRGSPEEIRCDDGPEYISSTLQRWEKNKNTRLQYIQLGKPQQNSYVERYNRTVRYDWLNHYLFESIDEMRDVATWWLWSYNNERPNMGISGITPAIKLKAA